RAYRAWPLRATALPSPAIAGPPPDVPGAGGRGPPGASREHGLPTPDRFPCLVDSAATPGQSGRRGNGQPPGYGGTSLPWDGPRRLSPPAGPPAPPRRPPWEPGSGGELT